MKQLLLVGCGVFSFAFGTVVSWMAFALPGDQIFWLMGMIVKQWMFPTKLFLKHYMWYNMRRFFGFPPHWSPVRFPTPTGITLVRPSGAAGNSGWCLSVCFGGSVASHLQGFLFIQLPTSQLLTLQVPGRAVGEHDQRGTTKKCGRNSLAEVGPKWIVRDSFQEDKVYIIGCFATIFGVLQGRSPNKSNILVSMPQPKRFSPQAEKAKVASSWWKNEAAWPSQGLTWKTKQPCSCSKCWKSVGSQPSVKVQRNVHES